MQSSGRTDWVDDKVTGARTAGLGAMRLRSIIKELIKERCCV